MRYKPFFSTPFVASLTIGFVFFALLTLLLELPNRQIIQKKAASAQDVYIYFVPSDTKINTNQVTVSMYAKFATGAASEKIDYFKTRVVLPSGGQFLMPANSYVTTTFPSNGVNFDRIFHVDGPSISNTNKAIIVELGSQNQGGGPSTDPTLNGGAGLKVAEFVVWKNPNAAWTAGQAVGFTIDISQTQVVVSPLSEVILPTASSNLVSGSIIYDPTYGISPTPTSVPPTNTPVPTNTPTPTPTRTPTPVPPTVTGIPPTLTTAPTIIACTRKAEGDANCDNKIDGIDYSIWLNSQCHPQPGTSAFCSQVPFDNDADFDRDGNRDDTDYRTWFSNRWT